MAVFVNSWIGIIIVLNIIIIKIDSTGINTIRMTVLNLMLFNRGAIDSFLSILTTLVSLCHFEFP